MRMRWVAGAMAALTLMAATVPVAEAQWRGRYNNNYYHRGGGNNTGAIIGGLVAGALIGGAIASSQRGYYGPGPGYAPGYGAPPQYGYAPRYAGPPGDVVGYCMSRFKSYDPRSGTYLGYDGYRHPCP